MRETTYLGFADIHQNNDHFLFGEHFYTPQEQRKLKLEKLNERR